MRFIHANGLNLVKNSWFRNLRLENLKEDPDPKTMVPGRIWFNSSDNLYKGSYTDGDAIKVLSFTTEEKLNEFMANIQSTEAGKGANFVGFEGEEGPNSLFKVDASSVTSSLKNIVDAIDNDRKVINDSKDDLNSKINDVQNELDTAETGAGLEDDGTYKANDKANYISAATSLKDADDKLDAQVKTNADNLTQETQDRKDADDAITKDLNDFKADANTRFLDKTTTDEQTVAGAVVFKKSVTVQGNFYVPGGVTNLISNQVTIGDNIVTLNNDIPDDADPTENAGLEINRGKEGVMPFVIWDEGDDKAKVVTGKDDDGNWVLDVIATGTGLKDSIDKLQGEVDDLQKELDDTQTGAGLEDDGTYKANDNANYIAKATSLKDADDKLDNQAKSAQDEIDRIEVGAGLNTDGTYTANSDANYISEASSLRDADDRLDAALKTQADKEANDIKTVTDSNNGTQNELDDTQTGAGLEDDGSYKANSDANYIADATSLKDADNKLDAQVKANADAIASNSSDTDTKFGELRKEIDGIRFIYADDTSKDPATSYTVDHNLGTEFVDFTLWVLDPDDNKWYNDLATVKVVDANNVEVDLSDARHIRIVITNVEHLFAGK